MEEQKTPATWARRGWIKQTIFLFGSSFGFLFSLAGCATQDAPTSMVQANPFGASGAAPAVNRASFNPAPPESAARVDTLGRKLLAANPQIGCRPFFQTIGAPQPEIFHAGTAEVFVTDGLVKQCHSENELAALLCNELGRMVAEREALASPALRSPDRHPPLETRIGNDNVGGFGPPDLTRQAELAKFERDGGRPVQQIVLPDPQQLARTYMKKAGYNESDLETVQPLLQEAAKNMNFEKQFIPKSTARPWDH